jgi:hypothetical protein
MVISGRVVPPSGEGAVAAFRSELRQARAGWWEGLLAPGPSDRAAADAAVAALYAAAPKPCVAPRMVWCGSPLALVRAAADLGGGRDVADEVVYRAYRRELAAASGSTTKGYRLRTHLLAELLDDGARWVVDALWAATLDALKAAGERWKWDTAVEGSVWQKSRYDGDWEIPETTQPSLVASLSLAHFLRSHWGVTKPSSAACDLVRSCGGFVLREDIALLSERHLILSRDDRGRLHDSGGPAVLWPDGFAIYAWHGTRVTRDLICNPETLDPTAVLSEPNAEKRRVMIERIGYERLVRSLRMKPVAKDKTGRLWRIDLPLPDEPLLIVEVENATKEHDGSRKRYFLRVPPDIRKPHEAVAWTFGVSPDENAPDEQT